MNHRQPFERRADVMNFSPGIDVLVLPETIEDNTTMDTIIPGGYLCVITDEPDELFRRFLRRKARESGLLYPVECPEIGQPLDISIHDRDDEIVAGLVACTHAGEVVVSLVWVCNRAHGEGLEMQMLRIVEAEARQRGCTHARVRAAFDRFYADMGYATAPQPPLPANVITFAPLPVTMQKDLA